MFKAMLGGLFALSLVGCATGLVDYEAPYASSIRVTATGNAKCSGTMIAQTDKDVSILTAGHCTTVTDLSALQIVTETCGTLQVVSASHSFYEVDDGARTDVGLLTATKPTTCTVATADIANDITLGESVVVVGYPEHLGKAIAFGYVSNIKQPWTNGNDFDAAVFQLAGAPGNSGSGIFNSDGEIVGVLTGPATKEGFGLIRSDTLDDIKAFINKAL